MATGAKREKAKKKARLANQPGLKVLGEDA
jgi:hypothetical protein